MRIYLAGPITGYDLWERKEYFAAKTEELEDKGYEVVNPFDCHPLGVPWEEAMRADIRELATCEGIYLTPGWEKSSGVRLELNIAMTLGMEVIIDAPGQE